MTNKNSKHEAFLYGLDVIFSFKYLSFFTSRIKYPKEKLFYNHHKYFIF